jgi:hypothetical protein
MQITEVKKHVKTENTYALFLFIMHVHLLVLVVLKSVNISGVPFNNTKFTQDGRIVGGTETTIENHPYQVQLLN